MTRSLFLLSILAACSLFLPCASTAEPCVVADRGDGAILFPPDCPYDGSDPMMIIDGLAPGTTLELHGPLTDFFNVIDIPGGSLGGEICTFDAVLVWNVVGTGDLLGYTRSIQMPVTGEIHIGPQSARDPEQTFPGEIWRLTGELFGDPDFCALRFDAGGDFGLPSPGQTTLTRLPSGGFAVDSFFDITYRIEFEGCPGSPLDGFMGSTTATVHRATGPSTFDVDWCRLQWPLLIEEPPVTPVTVYGHLYIAGLTDLSSGNDPVPGIVLAQAGYGPDGSDPNLPDWSWFDAEPNPDWNDAGEPGNDEYMAEILLPAAPGEYDHAYRFSGDGGATWTYADRATGVPGEDGSENGYQTENADLTPES